MVDEIARPADGWKRQGLDRQGPNRNHSPWGLDRKVTITAILSVITLIFLMGVNYQRLTTVDNRLQTFITTAEQTYVRHDVTAAQWENVNYQLQELRMQVDELTDIVNRQDARQRATSAQPPPPRFQRK